MHKTIRIRGRLEVNRIRKNITLGNDSLSNLTLPISNRQNCYLLAQSVTVAIAHHRRHHPHGLFTYPPPPPLRKNR